MREYPYLSKAIAITLTKYRTSRKISKSALSDFASIERCYLRDMEKGNRKPTVNTIFCICEVLQISPNEFIKEVEIEIKRLKEELEKK